VNYDVPVERDGVTPAYDTYLHRIGRSGRFGRKGAAFNLVCGQQARRRGFGLFWGFGFVGGWVAWGFAMLCGAAARGPAAGLVAAGLRGVLPRGQ
jgi:hypothetical protein